MVSYTGILEIHTQIAQRIRVSHFILNVHGHYQFTILVKNERHADLKNVYHVIPAVHVFKKGWEHS